jgi:acyl-CoA dehydrogenase
VRNFLDNHIVPRIGQWQQEAAEGKRVSFMSDLKALAREE